MDPALQHDVAIALALVTAAQLAAALASKITFLPTAPDLKERYEASDAVLLPPLFTVVGYAACVAAWELRGSVEDRWTGETVASRWCMLLYCAKQAIDVPVQANTLAGGKRLQMVGHHLLSLVAIGTGLLTGRCHFFACLAVCSEISTPFLSLGSSLRRYGSKTVLQNTVTIASGLGLWLAYLPFRLANFPAWLWVFFADQRANPETTSAICTTFEIVYFPVVIFFLLVLSVFWFYRITLILLRALGGGGKKSKKSN